MELSSEDLLRINVLLAQNVEAIRIDEQDMTVYGLSGDAEAQISLNPNCRPEQYLRRVREVLSSHALGSPGGYPVFLQRWTRMGQARGNQLDKLLLLGEPEAVVAVAGAADLTDELARRAWWCQPTMENAQRMLEHEAVARGTMGSVLADFLVEHLPFETDHIAAITTIKLVLQPGLIDEATRRRIWSRGTHRNAYHLGFLEAAPDDLPDPLPPRADYAVCAERLSALARTGNRMAVLLGTLLDRAGQTFLSVSETQLRQPIDKFTVAALLNTIGDYFSAARVGDPVTDVDVIGAQAQAAYDAAAGEAADTRNLMAGRTSEASRDTGSARGPRLDSRMESRAMRQGCRGYELDPIGELAALREALPDLRAEIVAMLALGHTCETLAIPIIAQTTATGTLLRRKLEPVTNALLAHYGVLRKTAK